MPQPRFEAQVRERVEREHEQDPWARSEGERQEREDDVELNFGRETPPSDAVRPERVLRRERLREDEERPPLKHVAEPSGGERSEEDHRRVVRGQDAERPPQVILAARLAPPARRLGKER